MWSDIVHVHSLPSLDRMLWQATTYCLPLDTYRDFLGVDERLARTTRQDCLRRVGRTGP